MHRNLDKMEDVDATRSVSYTDKTKKLASSQVPSCLGTPSPFMFSLFVISVQEHFPVSLIEKLLRCHLITFISQNVAALSDSASQKLNYSSGNERFLSTNAANICDGVSLLGDFSLMMVFRYLI